MSASFLPWLGRIAMCPWALHCPHPEQCNPQLVIYLVWTLYAAFEGVCICVEKRERCSKNDTDWCSQVIVPEPPQKQETKLQDCCSFKSKLPMLEQPTLVPHMSICQCNHMALQYEGAPLWLTSQHCVEWSYTALGDLQVWGEWNEADLGC